MTKSNVEGIRWVLSQTESRTVVLEAIVANECDDEHETILNK